MKPEEFVVKIKHTILDENAAIYKDLFEHTPIEQTSDPYWNDALKFFNQLGDNEKKVLFKIMRQVSVNTVSNFFAVLDGVSCLEGQDGDFNLTVGDEKKSLNGELQDILLELEE